MPVAPVAPRALIGRALEHLPKTFDESWLRETWAGGHGRLRLRADITSVTSSVTLHETAMSAAASVSGGVIRRTGTHVGSVTRRVKLEPNGRLGVYHAYLSISPQVQKSGFASRFNGQAFERYAAAGVDDVTVSASLSAGGYVWARTGFEMKAPAFDRAQDLAGRIEAAFQDGRISRLEYDAIKPRLLVDSSTFDPDFHLSSIKELAQMEIGERVLKGNSFSGIRELHPASSWWAPSAPADASLGAAYLRSADVIPAGVRQARNAVAATLPEVFDPAAISTTLERATSALDTRLVRTGGAKTSLDIVGGTISGSVPMHVVDRSGSRLGNLLLATRVDDDGLVVVRREWGGPDLGRRELSSAVDDALRGAGVTKVEVPAQSAEGHELLHVFDLA